jgi:diguanylate cyclase (GGDEF)-like protein/PAS domain S-box-containing protein
MISNGHLYRKDELTIVDSAGSNVRMVAVEHLEQKDNHTPYVLVLLFLVLAAGIITAGYLYYRSYTSQHRVEIERQLSAIADLKVGELAHWRKERFGDAAAFFGNEAFSALVRRSFNHPNDLRAQRQIWTWLSKIQLGYSYERLLLFDARGALRMSVPDSKEPVASGLSERAAIVMRSEQIDFQDFYRDEQNQRIYLTIMVPILSKEDGGKALGTLVLRIDPETYLYPLIRYWPTPSRTAETLLVRREGNEVVFLNDLRFQQDTALKLRVPLEKVELPAVKAVMGQEGIVEGKDYRGVPVIAAIRSIPDSPWFISSRMDLSEVYGPLKERLWLMIILVVALLIGVGAGIGLVWRQQNIRFYRERHAAAEALRESEELFKSYLEYAPDGVYMSDLEGNFLYGNRKCEEIIGYQHEELIGKNFLELNLLSENSLNIAVQLLQANMEGKPTGPDEIELVSKEGRLIPVEINTSVFQRMGQRIVLAFVRDITERRRIEEALQENRSRLADIVTFLPDATLAIDKDKRIIIWNKAIEEMTGVPAAEMIGKGDYAYAIPFYGEARPQLMDLVFLDHKEIEARYPTITREGNSLTAEAFCNALYNNKGAWVFAKASPLHDQSGNIIGAIESIRDITAQKQAEEQIRQMAYHDSLTGLPNRKLFSDRLGIALAQAQRSQKGVAVTMLDLDHFKDVNDTLGHDVGDLLLKAAAERLSAALRKGDTVARFGGDEFVLILPDLKGMEDVIQVAQKIVESFRQPFLIDTHQLIVTTSIGIAVYPHDGTDEGILLKNADIAMYQVKQTGRDRYQLCKKA